MVKVFIMMISLNRHSNSFFHVLTENAFKIRSKKAQKVFGIDSRFAYLSTNQKPSRELRQHVSEARDLLHVLALETNGTVFQTKALHDKRARALIARRMADNEARDTCFDCDCALSRDHVTAEVECMRCEPRAATVEEKPGVEWAWSQEWEESDDYSEGAESDE